MTAALDALMQRRARLLGPAYRLFYDPPLEVCRGAGTRLYDPQGRDYLDAYNNVVPAGHAHPRIVQAIAAQLGTLSTHTRYLERGILDYAEDLLGTLGSPLGHLMLTCTGSEANDLALRIAFRHTGRRGIIVTANAYHGTTALTASFSPSLGAASPLGEQVRLVAAPDPYREGEADAGARLAAEVQRQIDDLHRHGEGLAAFVADMVLSSDGVVTHPAGLFAPAVAAVRAAGGLVVADEVQAGFGRTGEAFWGHSRHGLSPDMVTMGKPMGSGYPVAGLAVAPAVVEAFGRDTRYFNTFGGNSVAVAAAQATLDVIRDEDLQANAARIGGIVRTGLVALAGRHACVGDIRGAGLSIGVELVADRGTKAPDAARARAAVNAMRARGVLISSTGAAGNVLKIRPPLVFSEADADRLLTTLEASLAALARA